MKITIKLLANEAIDSGARGLNDHENGMSDVCDGIGKTLDITGDINPLELALDGVSRVDLHFPKFTDGRAYSQAFLLRRRMKFNGEIRANGDVLVDQLVQMQRAGFDAAVLREDQNLAFAQAQFDRFNAFYQGDAVTTQPLFAVAA